MEYVYLYPSWVDSQSLGQSYDCSSASEVMLNNTKPLQKIAKHELCEYHWCYFNAPKVTNVALEVELYFQ